jgi:hypothetical protein
MTGASADSDVQRRLAELDARLRAMQDELEHDLGPFKGEPTPSVAAPPDPTPERRAVVRGSMSARQLRRPVARLGPPEPAVSAPRPAADARLEAMCASLLRSLRELLAGYEIALGHVDAGQPAPSVTLAAGPFSGIEVLEEFQRAMAELPQVADVSVRGYEGRDRAILEVRLRG